MARIQDVIDSVFRSERGIPFEVLDMLNAKYLIDQQSKLSKNPSALGNAWYVDSFVHVNSATEELSQLKSFNSRTEAIIHDKDFGDYASSLVNHAADSNTSRSIAMTQYAPNRLVYKTNCEREEFAVFSEIWYGPNKGWTAYIDNQKVDVDGFNHVRVNYLLRGMKIPAGEHEIVFEFNPKKFVDGEKVSLASSLIILLLIGGWLFSEFKNLKS